MPNSIQIVVEHTCSAFSGERVFMITEHPDGFSAKNPQYGTSRTFATPILAVLALVRDNGGKEARA